MGDRETPIQIVRIRLPRLVSNCAVTALRASTMLAELLGGSPGWGPGSWGYFVLEHLSAIMALKSNGDTEFPLPGKQLAERRILPSLPPPPSLAPPNRAAIMA